MNSDSSFEDMEGDYLRECEERRNLLVSRDTEDILPVVPQPIPPPVVPAVVPPLVSVSNATSERTDTSSGSSMSYPSVKEENESSTSTFPTPPVVVVTIKRENSISATPIPADLLDLPPPAVEFSHKKPSVNIPLVSDIFSMLKSRRIRIYLFVSFPPATMYTLKVIHSCQLVGKGNFYTSNSDFHLIYPSQAISSLNQFMIPYFLL